MKRQWKFVFPILCISGIWFIQVLHLGGKLSGLDDLNESMTLRHLDPKSWAKQHFQEAGMVLDASTIESLPTNVQIQTLLGPEPLIVGNKVQCSLFRQRVPNPNDRWMGVAGCFNTGTNLLAQLLQNNCIMPGVNMTASSYTSRTKILKANKQFARWQVPWGKHTFSTESRNNTASTGINVRKGNGLAVVTVRDPYAWAKSMCKNPYSVKWTHYTNKCPNLKAPVLNFGGHTNLLQYWNVWYQNYVHKFPYPRILVRVEDLTLRPHRTIQRICDCAGGQLVAPDQFQHVVQSAKTSNIHRGGHTSTTGMMEAWKKVIQKEPNGGFSTQDYDIAKQTLDTHLMTMFGYKHPPPSG
jgi:hypothetical protein